MAIRIPHEYTLDISQGVTRVRINIPFMHGDSQTHRFVFTINDGNDAIGVPRKQFNLGGEWDLGAVPGLTLTARTIYTGEQYVDQVNQLTIPDWVRVDVGARYSFESLGKPVVVRANLDNLFDEDYISTINSNGFPLRGDSQTLLPGAPRQVFFTLRKSF